jgi:hypothetical protein
VSKPESRIEDCLLCGGRAVVALHEIERLPLVLHAVARERRERIPWLPFRAGVCCSCGHLQQVRIPDPSTVAAVYTEFFETYQSTVKTGIGSLRAERFLEFPLAARPARGVGARGRLLRRLLPRAAAAARVRGPGVRSQCRGGDRP